MNRTLSLCLAALAVASLAHSPVEAQTERRFELLAGFQFPLLSQTFQVEQKTGFNAGVAYEIAPRWSIGALYESYASKDDIGRGADADLTLYGLTGTYSLNDDPEFEILALVSAGTGELEYANPGPADPVLVDSTDISLWYEGGVGVQFRGGERWLFRIKVGVRQVKPDEPSILLPATRSMIVPAFQLGFRF